MGPADHEIPYSGALICGGAVLEVHNRGLRKLDLVAQKFFIKKIFFYHIFPFSYKKILNFILVSRSGKKFFLFVNWKNFTFFYHILEGRMSLSLTFISRVSALPYSRSRTHLSYNTTDGGEGVGESLIMVLYETITRFKNGLGVGLRRARQLVKTDNSAHQNKAK